MANLVLSRRHARHFVDLHPVLHDIIDYVLSVWPAQSCYVTSIRRTPEENKAAGAKTQVHVVGPPYRAVDLRIRNLPADPQARALSLAKRINRRWVYDPTRKHLNVAYARAHGSGPHIHLQVHPRTHYLK